MKQKKQVIPKGKLWQDGIPTQVYNILFSQKLPLKKNLSLN